MCVSEYYSPGWVELKFGGQPTGIKNLLTVFDSGSSYTYLYPPAYEALITLVSEKHSEYCFPNYSVKTAPDIVLIIWIRLWHQFSQIISELF